MTESIGITITVRMFRVAVSVHAKMQKVRYGFLGKLECCLLENVLIVVQLWVLFVRMAKLTNVGNDGMVKYIAGVAATE